MKKLYISLFIVGILSLSLVAAAGTGWSIKDLFQGKQAKAAPGAVDASCNAQIAQNRQLLLLIANHLGIEGMGSITGNPIRRVARRAPQRQAAPRAPRAVIPRAAPSVTLNVVHQRQVQQLFQAAAGAGLTPHQFGLRMQQIAQTLQGQQNDASPDQNCAWSCQLAGCSGGSVSGGSCVCTGCSGESFGNENLGMQGLEMGQMPGQLYADRLSRGMPRGYR